MKPLAELTPERILGILDKVAFFREFNGEERLQIVAHQSHFYVAEAGELIIKQYTKDTSFYVLLSGVAKVFLNGQDEALDIVEPGQFFGEIAFLKDKLRTSNVAAAERAIVLKLDRDILQQLGPAIREKIKDQIIEKLLGIVSSYNAIMQDKNTPTTAAEE